MVDLDQQENKITKVEKHKQLCDKLNEIYAQKNHDYNDSFGETYKKLGIISAVTRITDKYNRLCSLATKSESERMVKDESIKDTLMDLANYAVMTALELDGNVTSNDNGATCDSCKITTE